MHIVGYLKALKTKRNATPRQKVISEIMAGVERSRNFAAKLQQALEEARPHRDKAAELFAQAKDLEDRWRVLRNLKKASADELGVLEAKWKETERAGRESLAKGEAIEDAVYDLKAVNPNRVVVEDKRTPVELLDFIAQKGQEADAALARLRELTTGKQT